MTDRDDEPFVPYANRAGNAGVVAYRVGRGFIDLEFRGGERYRYDDATTGRANVERMRALAEAGRGLTTFVSRHVKARYARRLTATSAR